MKKWLLSRRRPILLGKKPAPVMPVGGGHDIGKGELFDRPKTAMIRRNTISRNV
jgi:hypothetical protein